MNSQHPQTPVPKGLGTKGKGKDGKARGKSKKGANGRGKKGRKGNSTTASADCEDYDQEHQIRGINLIWEEPEA
eukprot:12927052-Prorocentrum_lima.AAC.1